MSEVRTENESAKVRFDRQYLDRGIQSLAGVDEAGRGPLAGPVVAAAVIVRDFSFSSSVNDSKKMSAKARDRAYEEIMQKAQVSVSVIEHAHIDRINIFKASMQAMAEAVTKLGVVPDYVLIDGPHTPDLPFKQQAVVDGDDKSFTIACASVIAKVTRDRIMDYYDTVYPEYGFSRHKGYGTAEHLAVLSRIGPCGIHRKSFAPVSQTLERISSDYGNAFNH